MHPPPFRPDHLLADWPECHLEVRCPSCRKVTVYPVAMLMRQLGDKTFRAVLAALRCERCGVRPAPVYLLADQHRVHCGGSPPGWAVEVVAVP